MGFQAVYGHALHSILNFAVNLKLQEKINSIKY